MHLPIVLQPGIVLGNRVAFTVHKRQPAKTQVSRWRIVRALLIDLTFDTNQLCQTRRHDWRIVTRPKVEFAFRRIEYPLARFVEFLKRVFDPTRFGLLQEMKPIHRVGCIDRRTGNLPVFVHRFQRQNIDNPSMMRAHDDFNIFYVGPVFQTIGREVKLIPTTTL